MKQRVTVLVAVTIACFAGLLIVNSQTSPSTTPSTLPTLFYGRIEDGQGAPLGDVKVTVRISQYGVDKTGMGVIAPITATQQTFAVYSNKQGMLGVSMPSDYNELIIASLEKDGYEWLFDWAWTLGGDYAKNSNKLFLFPGGSVRCPYYRPDGNVPAVFVMHAKDDPAAIGSPSRGGAEMQCDGKPKPNERVAILVPSAGPDAPRTPAEIEKRLLELTQQRNATR